jgi:hypothetical protein
LAFLEGCSAAAASESAGAGAVPRLLGGARVALVPRRPSSVAQVVAQGATLHGALRFDLAEDSRRKSSLTEHTEYIQVLVRRT